MLLSVRTSLALIFLSLTAAAILAPSASTAKRAEPVKHVTSHKAINPPDAVQQAAVVRLRRAIGSTRRAAWRLEDFDFGRHTRTNFAERHITSVGFLRWDLRAWHSRWVSAKNYARANPWARMVWRTHAYRMCIIGHESANAGRYKAENGGTRYVEGPKNSDASGAYQFLNSTWQRQFAKAKEYFKGKLNGGWYHAADAPPKVQDIVAAYDIAAAVQNHHPTSWTWPDCAAKGLAPA